MEAVRFEKFTLLIDGIHKCMGKFKTYIAPDLGIKGVHVFWLYTLYEHPEGLSSAELATASAVDRSLVSREIAALAKSGYVCSAESGSRRSYNARLFLTEKGKDLAKRILSEAKQVQSIADQGISEEELYSFYSTLEKLHENFQRIIYSEENGFSEKPQNN